jgi:putative nucleotidyltransferase with HDIG domain
MKTFKGFTHKSPSLNPIVRTLIKYRYIVFSFGALGIWLDHAVYTGESLGGLYVLLMIFMGSFYPYILQGVLQSLLVNITKCFTDPDGFPNIEVFLFQWFSYFAIWYIVSSLVKKNITKQEDMIKITSAFARALDSRDKYTADHSENVARYAEMIAKEMGMSSRKCEDVKLAAQLHDIGKIGIPEVILNKPSKLSKEEFEVIKSHPAIGHNMVKDFKLLKEKGVLDAILYHHEREDGSGYPEGLTGDKIPSIAKIIAVADSFDAITSKRVYRDEKSFEYAVNEILSNKGIRYDSDVVAAFERLLSREGRSILKTCRQENVS